MGIGADPMMTAAGRVRQDVMAEIQSLGQGRELQLYAAGIVGDQRQS